MKHKIGKYEKKSLGPLSSTIFTPIPLNPARQHPVHSNYFPLSTKKTQPTIEEAAAAGKPAT